MHTLAQHPSIQGHHWLWTGLCKQTDAGEDGHCQAGADPIPSEELGSFAQAACWGHGGQSWCLGDITPLAVSRLGLPLHLVAGLWRRLWRTRSCCRRLRVPHSWAASCAAGSLCICCTALSARCWLRHSWRDTRTSPSLGATTTLSQCGGTLPSNSIFRVCLDAEPLSPHPSAGYAPVPVSAPASDTVSALEC